MKAAPATSARPPTPQGISPAQADPSAPAFSAVLGAATAPPKPPDQAAATKAEATKNQAGKADAARTEAANIRATKTQAAKTQAAKTDPAKDHAEDGAAKDAQPPMAGPASTLSAADGDKGRPSELVALLNALAAQGTATGTATNAGSNDATAAAGLTAPADPLIPSPVPTPTTAASALPGSPGVPDPQASTTTVTTFQLPGGQVTISLPGGPASAPSPTSPASLTSPSATTSTATAAGALPTTAAAATAAAPAAAAAAAVAAPGAPGTPSAGALTGPDSPAMPTGPVVVAPASTVLDDHTASDGHGQSPGQASAKTPPPHSPVPVSTPAVPETSGPSAADLLAAGAGVVKTAPFSLDRALTIESPAPTPLPAPVEMVAAALRTARPDPDGTWRVSLQLHPADLGEVNVVLEVRGGVVAVHVAADSAAARTLLNEHIGELRSSLQQAGLEAGSMDIGGRQSSTAQEAWRPRSTFSLPSVDTTAAPEPPAPGPSATGRPATNSTLDLKL
jgi:flagellar hook-length control protein FliK